MGPYSTGFPLRGTQWHEGVPLEEGWIQRANAPGLHKPHSCTPVSTLKAHAASIWASVRTSRCCRPPSAECNSCLDWGVAGNLGHDRNAQPETGAVRRGTGILGHARGTSRASLFDLRRKAGIPRRLPEASGRFPPRRFFVSGRAAVRCGWRPMVQLGLRTRSGLITCLRAWTNSTSEGEPEFVETRRTPPLLEPG